jgi:transcription elongation factor GreA
MSELELKKQALKEEYDRLNHEFKIDLPKRIAEARAYGDLRENAEYDAARERQAYTKARMAQIADELSRLSEVDMNEIPNDKVGFGSKIMVRDLDSDDEIEFIFVSSNEVNPSEGKISLSSPIGQALQGRKVGDKVEVAIPAGKRTYLIEKVVTIHGNELVKGLD